MWCVAEAVTFRVPGHMAAHFGVCFHCSKRLVELQRGRYVKVARSCFA